MDTLNHQTPITLSQLATGQQATIARIHADEGLFHRLAAMGLRIGKPIQVIRKARFNGPMQVRVGTTDIMLRLIDAAKAAGYRRMTGSVLAANGGMLQLARELGFALHRSADTPDVVDTELALA